MNSATCRTILGWGLVLAALAGLVATAAAQERVTVKILTSSKGTVTNAVLGALAASLSKHVPGYTATAATVTPPSAITQLKDVGRGVADLSDCGVGLALDAVRGQGAFREGALNLQALAVFYPSRMQLVTVEGSGIAKLADLKGKRVSTGPAAGVVELVATRIFDAAGMDIERDIRRERLVLADAVKALQEGRIDAFFQFGNRVLSPILRDPAAFPGKKIKLIDTAEGVEAINRKYGPIYAKGAVPGGTYAGQDVAVPTLEGWVLLCAGQTVSEQVAYNVVKTLFEQKADLVAAHPDAADIALAKQAEVKVPIPFHPGALKYFAEKGIRVGNWTAAKTPLGGREYVDYPPSRPLRAAHHGGANYQAEANGEIVVLVMTETKEGLANLDAICATPALDAVYIGPADLSYALGLPPRGDNRTR